MTGGHLNRSHFTTFKDFFKIGRYQGRDHVLFLCIFKLHNSLFYFHKIWDSCSQLSLLILQNDLRQNLVLLLWVREAGFYRTDLGFLCPKACPSREVKYCFSFIFSPVSGEQTKPLKWHSSVCHSLFDLFPVPVITLMQNFSLQQGFW